jgi:anion-transporting  ArsA/GET3 family ATPase
MASILKQLSDDDLEAVRHMIRRDAHSDVEIAEEALKRLPAKERPRMAKMTDKAKQCVVERERKSAEFKRWRDRYENRDEDLRKAIALQKDQLQVVKDLVKDSTGEGFENLSNHIQAQALVLASKTSPDELIEGLKGKGWIKNAISLVLMAGRDRARKQAEELKAEIVALSKGGGKAFDPKKLVEKVDQVMGIKKRE